MKPDKGNNTLNVLFGVFLLVSIIQVGMRIERDYQKKKAPEKCSCGK